MATVPWKDFLFAFTRQHMWRTGPLDQFTSRLGFGRRRRRKTTILGSKQLSTNKKTHKNKNKQNDFSSENLVHICPC